MLLLLLLICAYILNICKVICNYLHLNPGNAQVCLSSFQLNEELHYLLHIQQYPPCFDSLKKKKNDSTTHYTHYTKHYIAHTVSLDAQNRTGPNRRQNPSPACTAAGINLHVS